MASTQEEEVVDAVGDVNNVGGAGDRKHGQVPISPTPLVPFQALQEQLLEQQQLKLEQESKPELKLEQEQELMLEPQHDQEQDDYTEMQGFPECSQEQHLIIARSSKSTLTTTDTDDSSSSEYGDMQQGSGSASSSSVCVVGNDNGNDNGNGNGNKSDDGLPVLLPLHNDDTLHGGQITVSGKGEIVSRLAMMMASSLSIRDGGAAAVAAAALEESDQCWWIEQDGLGQYAANIVYV